MGCTTAPAVWTGASEPAGSASIPIGSDRLQDPQGAEPPPAAPPAQRSLGSPPFPYSAVHVGAAYIPWARLDLDERSFDLGTPDPDIDDGTGYAVRFGNYEDSLGMEAVFSTTEHDDRNSDNKLHTYAAYVNLTDRSELWRGPIGAWMGVGAGLGLIKFDWDRAYLSELTALWQVEGIGALQLGPKATLEVRGQAFFAAHPTNTVGTGLTLMVGGTVYF